jgi:hypothetical protein
MSFVETHACGFIRRKNETFIKVFLILSKPRVDGSNHVQFICTSEIHKTQLIVKNILFIEADF